MLHESSEAKVTQRHSSEVRCSDLAPLLPFVSCSHPREITPLTSSISHSYPPAAHSASSVTRSVPERNCCRGRRTSTGAEKRERTRCGCRSPIASQHLSAHVIKDERHTHAVGRDAVCLRLHSARHHRPLAASGETSRQQYAAAVARPPVSSVPQLWKSLPSAAHGSCGKASSVRTRDGGPARTYHSRGKGHHEGPPRAPPTQTPRAKGSAR